MKQSKQITWTTEQAAREFGRSRTTVAARLADAGTKPDGDGKFTTQQICAALFGSAHSARIREGTARAELAEARTAILHRKWLPTDMVEAAWTAMIEMFRQRLLEVPSTVAGSDVGFTAITGQTLTCIAWSLKQVVASITRTVTVVPFTPVVGTVGVPLMRPELFMLRPSGHVPEEMLQV